MPQAENNVASPRAESADMAIRGTDYLWALAAILIVLSPNIWMMFYPGNVSSLLGAVRLSIIFVTAFLLVALPIVLFNLPLRVYLYFLSPFAVLAPLEIGYVASYGVNLAFGSISSIFDTSLRESLEYLSGQLLFVAATPVVSAVYFYLVTHKARAVRLRRSWRILLAAGIFLLFAVLTGREALVLRHKLPPARLGLVATEKLVDQVIKKTYPSGPLLNLYSVYQVRADTAAWAESLTGFTFGAYVDARPDQKQLVVFVLGEAARYESWGINGYERDTSPRLSGMDDLLSFSDVSSPATLTFQSVPIMLTRATVENLPPMRQEKSVVSAFKEAGFRTYWVSNQATFRGLVQRIAAEADETVSLSQDSRIAGFYDERVLPHLERILANNDDRAFVVLHLAGSHFAYSLRYPKSFERFTPSLSGYRSIEGQTPRNATEFRNAYDNSILYSDFVLGEVIDRLRARGGVTALLYTSDHGQNLYDDERGKFGHGTVDPSRVEAHVPLFLWLSEAYVREYPIMAKSASENRARSLSTADVFHWLLDMGRVRYQDGDDSRSIFSPRFKERKRLLWTPDRKVVEYDALR
jgi:glucan phosphoethanolaminetransferase (alkaline phosphatase superfamily)